ncbi:MAG: response regulator [Candidatus Aminicenantes bacterium]|nr:response regulator [Candidatus Aminicenantes bacterium]
MENTILVADDSASMRQLISFTLQGAGYQVIEAMDGADAVKKLKDDKIAMVISDLNMPSMDGMELLKYLRGQDSFRFIPVVMLTTESELSRVLEAKNAGISGWIIKPFEPKKLIDTVKKLLP